MNYYIGTAGFSYRDWEGIFYPKTINKLNYYSSIFNFVEINSTFYSIPEKHFFESIRSRIKMDFKIAIKANQIFTHQQDFPVNELENFYDLLELISPNLICVLFQFPYSFHNNLENLKKIELIKKLSYNHNENNINIAIEVRHKTFLNENFIKFCKDNDLIFVNIDQPQISYNLTLTSFSTNKKYSYFRFHGRKEEKWFSENTRSYERYDYLYNEKEINNLKEIIEENESENIIISFNNHYKAKAIINALELMEKLNLKPKISSIQIKKSLVKFDQNLI
ncbi:MAG: DUF72 domain-containing protein [Exilispira sp.]